MPRPDALAQLQRSAAESSFFLAGQPVFFHSAHGCLDLLGALGADVGGTLAQMVLPTQVAIAVQRSDQPTLRVKSAQFPPPPGQPDITIPLTPIAAPPGFVPLESPSENAWAAPLLALWWQFQSPGNIDPGGLRISIHGDVPIGAGQSSSTALLSAFALAMTALKARPVDPLSLAQRIAFAQALSAARLPPHATSPENAQVITALTCLHPREPRPFVLRYSSQPHRLVGPVPLPTNVRVLALDTGIRAPSPEAAQTSLEELRVAAAMGLRIIDTIYRDLGQHHTPLHGYLANTSPLLYRQYFRTLLPRRMRGSDFVRTFGPLPDHLLPAADEIQAARLYRVRTAVDHLIAENEHAEQFLQAIEELADASAPGAAIDEIERQRTLQRAGRLLLASHHSYRLRLELSCPQADWLVDHLMEAGPEKGIYGARITGRGNGGTVAALLDRAAPATDALLNIISAYHHHTGLPLAITEA